MFGLLFNPKVLMGLGLAAVIAMYGTYTWGYGKGYELAELRGQREVTRLVTEYNAAVVAARRETAQKQAELDAVQRDYIRISELRLQRNRDLQEKLNEYKEALASKPECSLDIDDLERLPAIE